MCRQNEGSFGFTKRWLLCRAKPNVPESVSVFIIFLLCLYAAKIFLSFCRCLFSRLACNGCVYKTFGISKHFPVKLQVFLIRAEMLDNTLTAKCFIYDVVFSCFILFVNPCVRETCSLSKFGRAADMCVCLMCMAFR